MSMRITDPEVIRKQERALFEAVTKNLDWEALSKIFRSHHRLSSISGMASKQGDFVAREGEVAYRIDFDVRAVLTVVFDRAGNYLDTGDDLTVAEVRPREGDEPGLEEMRAEPATPIARQVLEDDDSETIRLDQIIHGRSHMIEEPAGDPAPPPEPPPAEKMSRMASELAGMISNINGKKKR